MTQTITPEYVLGHSESELLRLTVQANYWGEATLEMLRAADIQPGMRLLDLGCGAGDVSLLAATLVGPTGSVLAIDKSPEAVATTRRRAASAGLHQIQCEVADIEQLQVQGLFDGIIGRFVLLYLADPTATLRALRRLVRPQGVLAFCEIDLTTVRTNPRDALFETAVDWMRETFRRANVPLDFGAHLWRSFRAAEIGEPSLLVRQKIEIPPAVAAIDYFVATLRSLLPMAERLGVVTSSEVDIETLSSRLREAAVARDLTLFSSTVIATWCRRSD
jgi:ubiquinone/menaquinone biosynthesis C-methylase UbiE